MTISEPLSEVARNLPKPKMKDNILKELCDKGIGKYQIKDEDEG